MKKYSILIITLLVSIAYGILALNYHDRYRSDDENVVLDKHLDDSLLVKTLLDRNYLPSMADAEFVSRHLKSILARGEELSSLYDLNKRAWRIPADSISASRSEHYKSRLQEESLLLGQDEEFRSLDQSAVSTRTLVVSGEEGEISVTIADRDGNECPDVVVRLIEFYIGSEKTVESRNLAYAKTDGDGVAVFSGLPLSSSYGVIPVREGYEYGSSKGTVGGTLGQVGDGGELELSFVQNEHKLRAFDALTLRNIKSDHVISVRSLESFFGSMAVYIALYLAVWWLIFLFYNRRFKGADTSLISLVMALTGICLVMMFSMNDPLNDKMIGADMAQGVIAGVVVMFLLLLIDFKAFYQDRLRVPFDIPAALLVWVLRPWRSKVQAFFDRMPKGFGYMLTALALTLLLFTPLGEAVGGMRVNLNIGILFQPSEIAKYLIVIFMASFFCANAEKIVKFSQKGNVGLFGVKLKMLGGIIVGLGLLMALYLLLGDMGPSMVLAFTFIIMYSIIKSKVGLEGVLTCDLAMLVYGILSFILMLFIGKLLGCMWAFCLAWFGVWIGIGIVKKQMFESAIVFNFIIAAFIYGSDVLGYMGLESIADRLEDRTEMCTNTWGELPVDGQKADPGSNTQVAEGLWGLASGGFFGNGIGEGNPSLIPAFHTDMILASIGEQFGFIGLLLVVVLLALLMRRTIIHGYTSSNTFTFYLCVGIAVVTGVQFVIIALGSTGVIPLTGVTVPFFSFGKVSMILNMTAFGVVLSIAARNAVVKNTVSEMEECRRKEMSRYDYPIALVSLVFCVMALFILGVFVNYGVINRKETSLQAVYVNSSNGIPLVKYNPRIMMIADQMTIGNIYDRNNILLATSDPQAVEKDRDRYLSCGVSEEYLDSHLDTRLRRYYPFGEHLFFMLGDYNTQLFFNSEDQRGYVAEARHLSHLRGYDDRMMENGIPVKVDLESDEYRPHKYLSNDSTLTLKGVQLRDYSAIYSSSDVKPGDIHLTLDARLQTMIQKELAKFVEDRGNVYSWNDPFTKDDKKISRRYSDTEKLRISVVILDADDGDLLASAVYPLPDQKRLMSLSDDQLNVYNDRRQYRDKEWTAYTDMDLGLLYSTAPGSTGKIMSSMAGMVSDDLTTTEIKKLRYENHPDEKIGYEYKVNYNFAESDTRKEHPQPKMISIYDALTYSSNSYFIKFVNDKDLYGELADIYRTVGARLVHEQPYSMFYKEDHRIDTVMQGVSKGAVRRYRNYMDKVAKNGEREPLRDAAWSLAWGQGELSVSPLAMARVASIAAGSGSMPVTRFTINDANESVKVEGLSKQDLDYLRYCMGAEAAKHEFGLKAYGKTGTAQRTVAMVKGKEIKEQDGWYMGYFESAQGPIAFALRLERGPGSGSAVDVVNKVLLPVFKNKSLGYVK